MRENGDLLYKIKQVLQQRQHGSYSIEKVKGHQVQEKVHAEQDQRDNDENDSSLGAFP